jgi:hypothetical protein
MKRAWALAASLAALAACEAPKVDEAPAPVEPIPHAAPAVAADDTRAPSVDRASKSMMTVRVVLAPDSPFAGPLYASLSRYVEPSDDRIRLSRRFDPPLYRVAFDGDRSATFHLVAPGRYAVELDVETVGSHISSNALGSGAFVRSQELQRTIPAEPVVTVGADDKPVEVVVSLAPEKR